MTERRLVRNGELGMSHRWSGGEGRKFSVILIRQIFLLLSERSERVVEFVARRTGEVFEVCDRRTVNKMNLSSDE